MAEQIYCSKCRKTMADTNYYTYKDGTKCELCKACLTMHINNWEPDTFLWLLEKFDVPYIEAEWNVLRDRAYAKDPYKMNGMSVFGKYLSKMKLKQWKNYTWADTERLKLEAEEKAKLYGNPNKIAEEDIAKMKEAYENGEITEAQYQTYAEIKAPEPQFDVVSGAGKGGFPSPYPVNDNPFEQVDIVDVGADLTQEDKVYLAMKWGRLYSAADWIALEQCYNDYQNSFDIHNADLEKGLIQLSKLDLKLNQALDSGDFDSYTKLSRSYDALRKSLKFTEAQNKDNNATEFDSVGAIVNFCEKEENGGYIPPYVVDTERDIIDTVIRDMKNYTKILIDEDKNIAMQIEQYIKKKEILDQQERDQAKALADGLDYVEISDEELIEHKRWIEEQKNIDIATIYGEEEE